MATMTAPNNPRLLVSLKQAEVMLDRSHWTIRNDIQAGRLRAVRINGRIYFEPEELQRFVNMHRG